MGARDKQGHVVRRTVGKQRVDDVVASGFQRSFLTAQCATQAFEPEVDVLGTGLDEAVGVEGEGAPYREFDLDTLERQAAKAERRTGWQVKGAHAASRRGERG